MNFLALSGECVPIAHDVGRSSIRGRVIPKTQKIVHYASLFYTQRY